MKSKQPKKKIYLKKARLAIHSNLARQDQFAKQNIDQVFFSNLCY